MQIEDGASGSEEQAARLESDADLAKAVTVHKSKGSEYSAARSPSPAACARSSAATRAFKLADANGTREIRPDYDEDDLARRPRAPARGLRSHPTPPSPAPATRCGRACGAWHRQRQGLHELPQRGYFAGGLAPRGEGAGWRGSRRRRRAQRPPTPAAQQPPRRVSRWPRRPSRSRHPPAAPRPRRRCRTARPTPPASSAAGRSAASPRRGHRRQRVTTAVPPSPRTPTPAGTSPPTPPGASPPTVGGRGRRAGTACAGHGRRRPRGRHLPPSPT